MLSLLQAARFFAAVLVVLDHATITLGMTRYFDIVLFDGLFGSGRYGVDFFFVLSGFIICYAHWDDIASNSINSAPRVIRFAKRRFVRIYPTYWLVFLITIIPLYFITTQFHDDIRSPWYLIGVATLIREDDNVITSAWTLTHEVLFYVLFGITIWRRNLGIALLAVWFVLSALSFTVEFPNHLLAHPEHLGFLFGMVTCYVVKTSSIPIPKLLFALGLSGFAACCVLAGYFHTAGNLNDMTAQAAARGPLLPLYLCSTLIMLGLVEMERSQGIRASAILRFLGDSSYSLYLVHFPVLDILIKISYSANLGQYIPFSVMYFAIVCITIVISLLFYKFAEKPLLKMVNKAMGIVRSPATGAQLYPMRKSAATVRDA